MNPVLVLGVNGQDGSFLTERLLSRGYKVIGLDRQTSSKYHIENNDFCYCQLDLCNAEALFAHLHNTRPDVIFHFAGVHGSAGTDYEPIWQDMLAVNTGSVQVLLEYLRIESPQSKLIYAGSGKVFGPLYPRSITEQSEMSASCLYTITKMAAKDLIVYYRVHHGVNGSILFLFNHESERRPKYFFIPKIIDILANAVNDQNYIGSVDTLDFDCDWGSAEEYMDIVVDISEKVIGDDFILGTGKTWHARNFVETLFRDYDLNYKQHVLSTTHGAGLNSSIIPYHVAIDKLESAIHRIPQRTIIEVCNTILQKNYNIKILR
ncbi:hypothetical protein KN63_02770 [Smithella sp. F21]|nr:hypothetical protein KN63_02770 [Smithella sp. F21]